MAAIIDNFEALRPTLARLAAEGPALPLSRVRLRAPLPRPGKILACIANYWKHGALEARPLNMFLKNSDAVIGPDDTIVLPEFTEPWIFMHEAELAASARGKRASTWGRTRPIRRPSSATARPPRGEDGRAPFQSKLTISTQFEPLPVGYLPISFNVPLAWSIE
jgi:hypothetical protein